MKRVLLIGLVLALCGTFAVSAAGTDEGSAPRETIELAYAKFIHPSIPTNAEAAQWERLAEKTGVLLKVEAIVSGEYNTKLAARLAADDFPDMAYLHAGHKRQVFDPYVREGAFLAVSDYYNLTPNYVDLVENYYPQIKKGAIDGKYYGMAAFFPKPGSEPLGLGPLPIIRKDILDILNLPVPETWDDLLTALRKMKEAYPDSYPWVMRSNINWNMEIAGYAMGIGVGNHKSGDNGMYYDKDMDGGKWAYGPIYPEFRETLAFFRAVWTEKLTPLADMSMNNAKFTEMIAAGQSFFSMENSSFFNDAKILEINPNAEILPLPALKNNVYGNRRMYRYPIVDLSKQMVINAKTANPARVMEFMDWTYTDEGCLFLSLGEEGETYVVENGKTKVPDNLIAEYKDAPRPQEALYSAFGLHHSTFATMTQNYDIGFPVPASTMARVDVWDPEYKAGNILDPNLDPPFNEAQAEVALNLRDEIWSYLNPEINAIVMGEKPLSEWDTVVEQIKRMGAQKVEDAWNEAEAAF